MADQIRIPVGLELTTQINQMLRQIRQAAEAELKNISAQSSAGNFPAGRHSVTAQQVFESGGKQFQVSARLATRKRTQSEIDELRERALETGQIDLSEGAQFTANIREIRQRTKQQLADDVKKLRELKEKIRYLPLTEQREHLSEFRQQFGDINNEISFRLKDISKKLRERVFRRAQSAAPTNNSVQGIEEQLEFWQEYKKLPEAIQSQADRLIGRLRTKLQTVKFQEVKSNIAAQSPSGDFVQDLQNSVRMWEDYMKLPDALQRKARIEINRLQSKMQSGRLQDLKSKIENLSPEAALRKIDDEVGFDILPDPLHNQVEALRRSLRSKQNKRNRSSQRTDFNNWMKRIRATEDLDVAMNELANYINTPGNPFTDDARIQRNRLNQVRQNRMRAAAQQRSRDFANMMLMFSGTGLGLLGPAGFPLLNVGFAAMSGGPVGAGIVGVATGLGEAARAIENFVQKTEQSARQLGFVSTQFQIVEARNKTIEAFLGAGAMASERAFNENRAADLKRLSPLGFDFERNWRALTGSFSESFRRANTPPESGSDVLGRGAAGAGILPFFEYFRSFTGNLRQSGANKQEDIMSAYRNMMAAISKPTIGVENDPYEIWKRIQNAALTGETDVERKVREEEIATMKELVQGIKENTKALTGEKVINPHHIIPKHEPIQIP